MRWFQRTSPLQCVGNVYDAVLGQPQRRRRKTRVRRCELIVLALLIACVADVHAQDSRLQLSGGVTAVGIYPDDSRIGEDRTLSADLFVQRTDSRGQWFVYIEGNSSLDQGAASTRLIEANADAGTALDADRNGRIQLSEINYQFFKNDGARLTVGLLDPSAYLDRSRITNDENVQFLGASFVNNPTIAFPDYTLGLVYTRPRGSGWPQLNAVLTSARGIADNPNVSYSQLIRFRGEESGAFAALATGWELEQTLVRVGAWMNTRPHSELSGTATDKSNYGAYAVLGRSWNDHALNLRLGLANDKVAEGSEFASVAYRYSWRDHAFGVGFARTFLSSEIDPSGLDDTSQLEIFARFTIDQSIHLTASVQRLDNSGFVAVETSARNSIVIAGLRFHYSF